MPALLRTASTLEVALVVLVFFVGLTLVSLGVGFAVERALPGKRIVAVPLAEGQLRFEALGNVVFLGIATVSFTAALRSEVVRFGEPSVGRDVGTFFALLVSFQVFYFFLHRAMHTRALLFLHRWHHRSRVVTPLSGQSMSAGEALGWMIGYVGLPLLLSRLVPIGFTGWAAYTAFNVFGNIVGHANVEPTAKPAATRAASIFANPFVYHALHHARWTVNYGFQAAGMDRLFGTECDDWEDLYARVSSGRPMATLHERGTPRGR